LSNTYYGGDELELDPAEREPNLGAPESMSPTSQENWARGGTDDREDDPAELGIGDADGLAEQIGGAH
jgi:hypothetical protein